MQDAGHTLPSIGTVVFLLSQSLSRIVYRRHDMTKSIIVLCGKCLPRQDWFAIHYYQVVLLNRNPTLGTSSKSCAMCRIRFTNHWLDARTGTIFSFLLYSHSLCELIILKSVNKYKCQKNCYTHAKKLFT